MKTWTRWGLVLACGLTAAGCKDEPTRTEKPKAPARADRTRWEVNGTLDAPHYPLNDNNVHAHVKAKFRLQVNTRQLSDPNTANGPVPSQEPFELLAFEVTDQHYHAPLPTCVPAAFGGTYAWKPKSGLIQDGFVGFRVAESVPSYQRPVAEGNCDTLEAGLAARSGDKDVLFWVPREVLDGQQPPAGGFVTIGEEMAAAESSATTSDKHWVFTWTSS